MIIHDMFFCLNHNWLLLKNPVSHNLFDSQILRSFLFSILRLKLPPGWEAWVRQNKTAIFGRKDIDGCFSTARNTGIRTTASITIGTGTLATACGIRVGLSGIKAMTFKRKAWMNSAATTNPQKIALSLSLYFCLCIYTHTDIYISYIYTQ